MALKNPIAAYNAESNAEAQLVRQHLESHGVESHVIDDNSPVGYSLSGIQIWVDQADVDRAVPLLAEYERQKLARVAMEKTIEFTSIEVTCEDCGKTSTFNGSLNGTVQDCPHCGSYVDVGQIDWPADDLNEAQEGDSGG